ncbi:cobyrinic acid a,c-diamide synthase [Candidatus Magnetobacterium bavaricum]|uniref:Cobyrinic acid a,c-diamide synthase n=1 Tax=Candidatus Magnetobacterium bavaricum TaxID=29290 RepID=A0A0F3GSI5_9BACT|nr:cobyrinic acid a,c-diamide synthase [Candidatus Magnetobacterium bavaricum]
MTDGQTKAKVISFINFKGGVGKTSNTVNIAGELAIKGHRVLVIDMDPQANSSIWLMGEDRFLAMYKKNAPKRQTVYHICLAIKKNQKYDIDSAIIKSVGNKDGIAPISLDLLPADYGMVDLEDQLTSVLDMGILQSIICNDNRGQSIIDRYEFVLIDCPPSLSIFARNALRASDFYIIPTIPSFLSRVGMNVLSYKVNKITANNKLNLKLLGIILNLGNPQTDAYKKAVGLIEKDLKKLIGDKIVDSKAEIFKTHIHNLVGITEVAEKNITLAIAIGASYSKPKELYQNVTLNILSHPYIK